MEQHKIETYLSEGRVEELDLSDIEEILNNAPTQTDQSQSIKTVYKTN